MIKLERIIILWINVTALKLELYYSRYYFWQVYLRDVRAVDGGGKGETELKDFVVSSEPEFEEAVEALEVVSSGPTSLDKFDDLKEVTIQFVIVKKHFPLLIFHMKLLKK